ncbi:MAG: serine/threonine protein kinase, partial [Planctomycetes bacterium]|nr:serine/threonine protein kinase [Planctomycetota bacterium]
MSQTPHTIIDPVPTPPVNAGEVPTGSFQRPDGTIQQSPAELKATAELSKLDSTQASAPPGYEIISELGRGGMGVVYKARQISINRIVALKMILSGEYASEHDLARFQAEAEAVAGLKHPHIVNLFEFGTHRNLPFFTLEYMEGGSLAKRIKDTPLSPQEAAQIVEQLARGMAEAHAHGIIHRDLKPENVLLAVEGTPKIADFGLAKQIDVGQASRPVSSNDSPGGLSYEKPELTHTG